MFMARSIGVSAGSGTGSNYAGAVAERDVAAGAATCNLLFNTDGTITNTGSATNNSTGFPCSWYQPTTASIGNSFWVRSTLTSGTFTTDPSAGTWLALSSVRTWTRNASSGNRQTAVATFEIAADAAGTQIVYSGTITVVADGT